VSRRAPNLLALAMAAVAILGILSAITPALRNRVEVLSPIMPPQARAVAAALTLTLCILLLILAGGLRRRKRRSWQASVVALSLVAVLHIVKGLDLEEAAASVALLAGLIVFRDAFDVEGDPETPTMFARHLAAAVAGVFVLGFLLIEGQSFLSGDALPPIRVVSELLHDVIGLGPDHLQGRGSHAVPRALVVYVIASVLWLTFLWLKPRRQYVRQHARDRDDARRIVRESGTDTLDYFALRRDKSYYFGPTRDAFIAYRVTAGVALISGDPVGPLDAARALLPAFCAYAHRHGWRVAAIGVGEDWLAEYEQAGLRTLYIGDEAVVDPCSFSLEGRAIRKVRQSVSRLRRAGYRVKVMRRNELSPEMLTSLLRVSQLWLHGQPERGFSMAMDDIWAQEHADAVFVIAIGPDDHPHGFVHLVPVTGPNGYSLSAMRRLPDTPNGLMEFLLCELFAWGAEHDVRRVSLNFNAFGELMRSETSDLPWWERTLKRSLSRADRYFQVERLLSFNGKFFPTWQPRYAAYEQRRDLPLAAIVLLSVESLIELPRPGRRRRPNASPRPSPAVQ
jgi:lysyl-tRNA synthetase, class II